MHTCGGVTGQGHLGHQAQLTGAMRGLNVGGPGSGLGSGHYDQFQQHQHQNLKQNQNQNQNQNQSQNQSHFNNLRLSSSQLPGPAGKDGVGGVGGRSRGGVVQSEGQDQFGLLGLLNVIRMSDKDLTTLALGTDLTTLGLNLNSRDNLYKTFASPWAETPTKGEPEFQLPDCYLQQNAPRLQVHLGSPIIARSET